MTDPTPHQERTWKLHRILTDWGWMVHAKGPRVEHGEVITVQEINPCPTCGGRGKIRGTVEIAGSLHPMWYACESCQQHPEAQDNDNPASFTSSEAKESNVEVEPYKQDAESPYKSTWPPQRGHENLPDGSAICPYFALRSRLAKQGKQPLTAEQADAVNAGVKHKRIKPGWGQ